MEPDLIIIGAGLSGFAAARTLTAAGLTVLLLEARERIGGRVLSIHSPHGSVPLDLGAEWFDNEGVLPELLKRNGHRMHEAVGEFLVRTKGAFRNDHEEERFHGVLRALNALEGADRSLMDGLRLVREQGGDVRGEQALLDYVQGFHAADPERMSLQWLAEVEQNQSAAASQLRAAAGAGIGPLDLHQHLGALCRIRTGCVVHAVEWTPGRVAVHSVEEGKTVVFEAKCALITLPLSVLRAAAGEQGAVRFHPPLASKRAAMELLATGNAVKVVLVFREAFWADDPELREALFVQDRDQPFPTWWSTRPASAPVWNGWSGGPLADAVLGLSSEALLEAAVRSLAVALGRTVPFVSAALVEWHTHDWAADPFARGVYSYVLPGGLHAHRALASPLESTLYFAGEATCGAGYNATMEGAVSSGERAARELLADRSSRA